MRVPPLSILESTPVAAGASAYAALRDSAAVAVAAEEAGYHRLWVSEHHAHPRHAGSAPAVLLGLLAERTTTLRLGSGGVMLGNHAPLVVAEQFSTLEAFHPGRIDLGVSGASGAPDRSAVYERALGRTRGSTADFPRRLDELLGFVSGRFPVGHPFADLRVSPRVVAVPVFVFGSSENGARLAGERGLPFALAHHLGVADAGRVLRRYRAEFRPSPALDEPYVLVTVGAVCAETDAEAAWIAFTVGLGEVRRREPARPGTPITPRERLLAELLLATLPAVVGGPATVAAGLAALAAETGADELMLLPFEPDGAGRIRTARLAARGYLRTAQPVSR